MPEIEEREQGIESIPENIITENFFYLAKEIGIQIQEVQTVPNEVNQRRTTSRCIIIKVEK